MPNVLSPRDLVFRPDNMDETVPHTQSMEREMWVKGTGSWCVLEEYVRDNYYKRVHNPSYHRYRETHFSILLDIKF